MSPVSLTLFFVFSKIITLSGAYPTGLSARQALVDVSVPTCAIVCASNVPTTTSGCAHAFMSCLYSRCLYDEFNTAVKFADGYCAGQGIVHTENGVAVTDVPPVPAVPTTTSQPTTIIPTSTIVPSTVVVTEFVTLSYPTAETTTTLSTSTQSPSLISTSTASITSSIVSTSNSSAMLRSPAAISAYTIISTVIIVFGVLLIRHWHRRRQLEGDYIVTTHRRTRGKSFLIDEASFIGRRRGTHESIELAAKSSYDAEKYDIERPLPVVPIPTKAPSPVSPPALALYIPPLPGTVTHAPSRSYTALPGRSPTSPPGLEAPTIAQTFAAGRERAMTNISHSRGSSSPSSPSSSTSPSSSASDIYSAIARSPIPAYTYQPIAPSPLRVQVRPGTGRVSTIQEEPRTPKSVAPAPSVFSSPPMSVFNSTLETAQRGRPTYASHVRSPRSAEDMRQFTFPMRATGHSGGAAPSKTRGPRQSFNEIELNISISDALCDDPTRELPPSRSQTPSGSMHRGAGGSTHSKSGSSVTKVHEKLQALVGGMRRERD